MNAVGSAQADEAALLELARGGDGDAFGELADAYRAELRAHCYRMLGSVHDADDALQEALLRAWRNLSGFQGRSSVRSWLYAIATNTALDITRHRSRRELPIDFGAPAAQGADVDPPLTDRPWLEPYPDRWLADDIGLSPEARYEQRESVELAFIVALQYLPPLQRAALLLREVVGLSAEEISSQLDTTTASVTSALQRARAAVRGRLPAHSQQTTLRTLGDQRTRAIAERYASAIEHADVDTLISMLTEDATWSMPPIPTWYRGHGPIRAFLLYSPLAERWRHWPTWANGQLAVGCYLFDQAGGDYAPAVIDVLTLRGDKIAAVTGFQTPAAIAPASVPPDGWIPGEELFAHFGLPTRLP
ncbi:MAG TPA: sigma-70 family RNA polymerase sigma factor [Streptosporangiaceae bacterium]|jgi:RNA polymerase sigma-70 factor (ECF subfamily)